MKPVDPLASLKDIHLPPPVSAWPPAPGWWIAGGLLLLAAAALSHWLWRRWRRRAYRRVALRQVARIEAHWREHGDARQLQRDLNRLLKQVALAGYPHAAVAALHETAWLQFLDDQLRRPLFGVDALTGFADVYRDDAVTIDPPLQLRATRRWIRRHRC